MEENRRPISTTDRLLEIYSDRVFSTRREYGNTYTVRYSKIVTIPVVCIHGGLRAELINKTSVQRQMGEKLFRFAAAGPAIYVAYPFSLHSICRPPVRSPIYTGRNFAYREY